MFFQVSDFKGKQFLDLLDNNLNIIESLYIKGEPWIKHFGHSNLLYVRAMRAITNYALIREYHLRFFLEEDFSCPYSYYLIETRSYILYKCRRFNNYWNLRRDTISQFISFLEFHPNVFSFHLLFHPHIMQLLCSYHGLPSCLV